MKQKDLADLMKVARQTVSRYTGDVRQIDLDTIARLCDALNVQVGDLLVYEPKKDKES